MGLYTGGYSIGWGAGVRTAMALVPFLSCHLETALSLQGFFIRNEPPEGADATGSQGADEPREDAVEFHPGDSRIKRQGVCFCARHHSFLPVLQEAAGDVA